jgi:UDP-N-acetylmuramate dehydrogenase
MQERFDVPLASMTTLRLGGPARRVVDAHQEQELRDVVRAAEQAGEPLLVLGGGSNVVVDDAGWPGTVVRLAMKGMRETELGDRVMVEVEAGETWDAFVSLCVRVGWVGVECLSGIPGLVGAAPIQNIGAYGQEVSDTLVRVRVLDRKTAAFRELAAPDCGFGYRASVFRNDPRFIVTSATFELARGQQSVPIRYADLARALNLVPGSIAPLHQVRETVLELRRRKGMLVDPQDPESVSAGSFFVNPVVDADTFARIEDTAAREGLLTPGQSVPRFELGSGAFKVPAAWLIERSGFAKGYRMGRAAVSHKHALALVNHGGTAKELLALAAAITDRVRERFGVLLHPEPIVVRPPASTERPIQQRP